MIYIDEEVAVEYDCNDGLFGFDYCVHILSRQPTLSQQKVLEMITLAGKYIAKSKCQLHRFHIKYTMQCDAKLRKKRETLMLQSFKLSHFKIMHE